MLLGEEEKVKLFFTIEPVLFSLTSLATKYASKNSFLIFLTFSISNENFCGAFIALNNYINLSKLSKIYIDKITE